MKHKPKAQLQATCQTCGKSFRPHRRDAKFCRVGCWPSNNVYKKQHPEEREKVPTGTRGAISELVAAADLLTKGFAVYRALSPSAPTDLMVLFQDQVVSVEVRTGYRLKNGKLSFPQYTKADLFAVILREEPPIYIPVTDKAKSLMEPMFHMTWKPLDRQMVPNEEVLNA